MTRNTRLIILLLCVACFFAAAPIIVGYSMGYRLDFERMKIVATGGIYIRSFPTADLITIDSKISAKPGMFANSIFTQSLLPKTHTVLVQKAGYFDYSKTLPVLENQVTKLENILLFKKDPKFAKLEDELLSPFAAQNQPEKFIIKNGNLYFSDTPQNSSITSAQKKIAVIKNILAFKELGGNILWLGTDGYLYQSDGDGKNPKKLALKPLKIVKGGIYQITADNQYLFLNNNSELLLLNRETQAFESFAQNVAGAKLSPDGKNLAYFTASRIFIYPFEGEQAKKRILLQETQDKISDVVWLNNDYIFFAASNKIFISETDNRGNVNTIQIFQSNSPKIYFNQGQGKLFILTNGAVFESEKITP